MEKLSDIFNKIINKWLKEKSNIDIGSLIYEAITVLLVTLINVAKH